MDIVRLTFRDITATCDWTTHDEVECLPVELIGWLVHNDGETVKVATAYSDNGFSSVHAVPCGCVVSTEILAYDSKPKLAAPSDS